MPDREGHDQVVALEVAVFLAEAASASAMSRATLGFSVMTRDFAISTPRGSSPGFGDPPD